MQVLVLQSSTAHLRPFLWPLFWSLLALLLALRMDHLMAFLPPCQCPFVWPFSSPSMGPSVFKPRQRVRSSCCSQVPRPPPLLPLPSSASLLQNWPPCAQAGRSDNGRSCAHTKSSELSSGTTKTCSFPDTITGVGPHCRVLMWLLRQEEGPGPHCVSADASLANRRRKLNTLALQSFSEASGFLPCCSMYRAEFGYDRKTRSFPDTIPSLEPQPAHASLVEGFMSTDTLPCPEPHCGRATCQCNG